MPRTTRAAALAKEARAIALHTAGRDLAGIAEEIGYAGPSGAHKALSRGLRAERDRGASHYFKLQEDRYEAIRSAWWQAATAGQDAKAANIVLRALERIDKLWRLVDGDPIATTQETLVISADPTEYARQLRDIAEERDRGRRAQP